MAKKFGFEDKGIADLLRVGRLTVPPNQRSYAWQERHVKNYLEDLNEAVTNGDQDYFLGTVVLIQEGRETPSIADGQQRIATTSIALARIRDLLLERGRELSARSIDTDFLRTVDRATEAMTPRLSLNLEDNEFFRRAVLASPEDHDYAAAAATLPQRASNLRLKEASDQCLTFFRDGMDRLPDGSRAEYLLKWVDFLQHQASVIVVTVPDEVGAFRMFETLNDRGLKASQADILKNYLFSKAGSRLNEAVTLWTTIATETEGIGGDENASLLTYLRHLWITKKGGTKERELAAAIRADVTSERRSIEFLTEAAGAVSEYLALSSSRHSKWENYPPSVKQHIETLGVHLQVEQIKPLLFAVARQFTVAEAEKAFKLFVSWSTRFLIYGGRGGMLDTQYSLRAFDVGSSRITKARELRDAMKEYVPSDVAFEQAFAAARVSRSHLARYYLRAIEKQRAADPQPEYVPNDDVSQINLEHVLPLTPTAEWGVDAEQARSAQRLLGNMALMREADNRAVANKSFDEKRSVYAKSEYQTTSEIAERATWTLVDIEARQKELAASAVLTWPLSFET
ncbi:MAG TPA: DUF262 domain-containing protein [Bosea sp. (in: a-proteobacteria)]